MSFPKELLRRSDTALCFFSAAFRGAQCEAYLRDAGLTRVVCFDTDGEKLTDMARSYPMSWTFAECDGFEILERQRECPEEQRADVVTLDPWGGEMDERLASMVPECLHLARRVLVYGVSAPGLDRAMTEFAVAGFTPRVIQRTEKAYWLVVDREAE